MTECSFIFYMAGYRFSFAKVVMFSPPSVGQVVCSCAGLCKNCGTDLNETLWQEAAKVPKKNPCYVLMQSWLKGWTKRVFSL